MNEETAFLDAIRANPDDDTARLVYADWLDDHDQGPRAECIRRGVRKPKRFTFAVGEPARVSFATERRDLGGKVDVVIAPGQAGVSWTTYKGTIIGATCAWEVWREFGDSLFEWYRLPEVELTTRVPMGPLGVHPIGFQRPTGLVYQVAQRYVDVPNAEMKDLARLHSLRRDPRDPREHDRDVCALVLSRRWPGATFHLPPAR